MNKISQLALLFLMMVGVWGSNAAAQGKNILFLHFESKHMHANALPADSIFRVTYRLQCPKPSRFHGFQITMIFETPKVTFTPIGSDRVIFDGSVAAGAGVHQATYDGPSGTLIVQALASGNMFDTSNHLLFQYLAHVKSTLADSASILISAVDAGQSGDPSVDSHIDTVIIEGTTGSPEVGWGPIAIAYLDSTIAPPKKKFPVMVANDSVAINSDSVGTVALSVFGGDSANVQSGTLMSVFDSSKLALISVSKGSLLSTATISDRSASDSIIVDFASPNRLADSGSLLILSFRAKHRTDTVCTQLLPVILTVTNTDQLVSAISYSIKQVCVLGVKKDTANSEVASIASQQQWNLVSANGELLLESTGPIEGGPYELRVYSINGVMLTQTSILTTETPLGTRLSTGRYFVVISDAHGNRVQEIGFSVVH